MTFDEMLGEVTTRRSELLIATSAGGDLPSVSSSEVWSIAQIVEHVALVEELIAGLLEQLFERASRKGHINAPAPAQLPLRLDLLGSLPRYDVVPAFVGSEPGGDIDLSAALGHINTARERFLVAAATGARYDCTRLVAPHFVGRLNFYEWIVFAAAHERLHLAQVEERSAGE